MDLSERAAIQEIVDRVSGYGPKEHFYAVLTAVQLVTVGAQSFHETHPGGAIGFHEQVLRDLREIPDVEALRALVHTGLIAEYAKTERYDAAIASGLAALPALARDSRLAYAYAACLQDIGAALIQSSRTSEGIEFMEQAMSIYDNLPDRSRGEVCRGNLERLRASLGKRDKRPSVWSRLFGKK